MEPSFYFFLFFSYQKVSESIRYPASAFFSMKSEFIIHKDIFLFWNPFLFTIFPILTWFLVFNGVYQASTWSNIKGYLGLERSSKPHELTVKLYGFWYLCEDKTKREHNHFFQRFNELCRKISVSSVSLEH